jgi:hypothetical protein
MWGILRIILLIANALVSAIFIYKWITDPSSARDLPWAFGFVGLPALNVVYLLLAQPSNWRTPNWRIFRLIGLWFDAKESELRRRADRSRQDK